jgi:tetratricopeptide (TPR) repeat protein
MSSSSHLHRADHPAWHQEPDFNPNVTTRLAAAYVAIQQGPDRIASFREAGYQLVALGDLPMCRQQRMNVCYLLGMAHAADDEYSHALPWLDRAVALADALDDQAAQADLLFLRGPVAQRLDLYSAALDDYRVALRLRRTVRSEHPQRDREQELHLLVVTASFALSQEEFALTKNLLNEARRLARGVVAAPFVVAVHDWTWAGYMEACGYPERALQVALRGAATAAAAQGGVSPYVVVRIYALAARLAADLAATHAEGSVGRLSHLEMASRCVRAARRALGSNDRSGKGYILMYQARLDALRQREARALERIAAAEQLAHTLDDGHLLIHALTVHGHILAERRDGRDSWKAALSHYREAQALAEERATPCFGLAARRALCRLEELLPDA